MNRFLEELLDAEEGEPYFFDDPYWREWTDWNEAMRRYKELPWWRRWFTRKPIPAVPEEYL